MRADASVRLPPHALSCWHLQGVKDSEALRAAVEEVQPENVKLGLRLSQSRPLYEGFRWAPGALGWGAGGRGLPTAVLGGHLVMHGYRNVWIDAMSTSSATSGMEALHVQHLH